MTKNLIKNLYIHIPFCLKKCSYCDFAVHAIGRESDTVWKNSLEDDYIHHLITEIQIGFEKYQQNISIGEKFILKIIKDAIESIYIGGGTPSLLSNKNLSNLFETIQKLFFPKQNNQEIEITIENEPNNITLDRLKK